LHIPLLLTFSLGGCEKRASSADVALSLIGFVASALVSLSPLYVLIAPSFTPSLKFKVY